MTVTPHTHTPHAHTPLTHPAVDAALAAASSLLGMEVVFIGAVTENTFTFERVLAATPWPGLAEGMSGARTDSLCHRMLDGGPRHTTDAEAEPAYRDAPERLRLGIRSYIGVPVRDRTGQVVATLCGIDRGSVDIDATAVSVLTQLAEVVASHLGPPLDPTTDAGAPEIVIRRSSQGGWQVGPDLPGDEAGDLTSAMVLADLLAGDLPTGRRPATPAEPADETERLRLSVRQLEHALATRVVVEQAIGVLAERQHTSPREAFERMRRVARSRGRKMHEVARDVVTSAAQPAPALPAELASRS